jgi:hypothetical protein
MKLKQWKYEKKKEEAEEKRAITRIHTTLLPDLNPQNQPTAVNIPVVIQSLLWKKIKPRVQTY